MQEKTKASIVLYFTIFYLFLFTIISMFNKNYEFIYYIFILTILIIAITSINKRVNLPVPLLGALTLIGVLHVIGGNIYMDGIRLYDLWFIQDVFRYDNLVHFLSMFAITLVLYNLLNPYLSEEIKKNSFLLYTILVLMTLGLGSLNEIIEFTSVVFLNAAEEVGDYMNNAVDLLFNFFGALGACILLSLNRKYFHPR